MPRAKRDKVVSLTRTKKKATREQKSDLIDEIRQQADVYAYIWLFTVEHMRNNHLKEVRQRWRPERIFLGKTGVMRKALGTTADDEYKPSLANISSELSGNVGLLFTNSSPFIVVDWFKSFTKPDYARTGNIASRTVTIPAGPVKIDDEVVSHALEPQLRKLGMPTRLVKGVTTLESEYTICTEGQTLKPDQINLLKQFNLCLAMFEIKPTICLNLQTGEVVKAEDAKPTGSAEEKEYLSGGSAQPVGQASIEHDKAARAAKKAQKSSNTIAEDEEMASEQEEIESDDTDDA